jgi:pimeloyl-ACP methyl ester carboxylesterase
MHLVDAQHEFVVFVWYPARSGPEGKPAPYISADETNLQDKRLASVVVRAHAWEEIPLAASPKRFPVLVMSAGSTTITELYSSLVEDLASRGFVVIGYGPTVIGNGVWKGDVTQVLDQLGVWNRTRGQMLFGRLELDHVGAFGHSAGGTAVATIAVTDKRVKALALLDPGAVPPGDGPAIPVLILRSEDSAFAGRYPEIEQERAATQHEFLRRAKPGIRITLMGAVHLSFTDMAVIKDFKLPGDGAAFVATTRAVIGEFFGKYLEGKRSELIEKGSAKYPWAQIQTPH